ncbi:phosphatase PAP2 family protein [Caulifigura coniformis]|nr:phosphatase PAP2 family protein [Caulifigura coniformis]
MDSTPIAAAAPQPRITAQSGSPISQLAEVGGVVPALLVALMLLAIVFVDVPLASVMKGGSLPDGIDKFLEAGEHFGTFYGHILAFLLIAALDPAHRRGIVRLAAAAWSAGLTANVVKLCIARTRPKYFDFSSLTAGHGFLGFAPGLSGGSRIQSFPSAHTATAVGFAIALSHLYPRGRTVFLLFAGIVGLQRIATSSHFASDVLAGAFVGWIVGHVFTSQNSLTSRLDAFEATSP